MYGRVWGHQRIALDFQTATAAAGGVVVLGQELRWACVSNEQSGKQGTCYWCALRCLLLLCRTNRAAGTMGTLLKQRGNMCVYARVCHTRSTVCCCVQLPQGVPE